MIGLDGLHKRQKIEIQVFARIVERAEIKSADWVKPFSFCDPVPQAVLFEALDISKREEILVDPRAARGSAHRLIEDFNNDRMGSAFRMVVSNDRLDRSRADQTSSGERQEMLESGARPHIVVEGVGGRLPNFEADVLAD